MATATTTTVEVQVTQTVEEKRFVLELTEDEAFALLAVVLLVGGNPKTTKRGLTDNVSRALKDAGVPDGLGFYRNGGIVGNLYFQP